MIVDNMKPRINWLLDLLRDRWKIKKTTELTNRNIRIRKGKKEK
jgi:hypothetical protein